MLRATRFGTFSLYDQVKLGPALASVDGGSKVVGRLTRNFAAGGIWQNRRPDLSRSCRRADPWEIMAFGLEGPSEASVERRAGGGWQVGYRGLGVGEDQSTVRRALVLIPPASPWC